MFGDAVEAGHADVAGVHDLGHPGPHHPDGLPRHHPDEGEDGQDEDLRVAQRAGTRRHQRHRREQSERDGEDGDEERARDELGERLDHHRRRGQDAVGGPPGPDPGPDPASDGSGDEQRAGQGGQNQRVEEAAADDGPHRLARVERLAEVASHHAAQPLHVALGGGPVEAEAVADGLDLFGGGAPARGRLGQDHGGGISGQELGAGEDEDRDRHQRGQSAAETPEGVADQRMGGGDLRWQARRSGSCTSRWRRPSSLRCPAPWGSGRPATWRRSG